MANINSTIQTQMDCEAYGRKITTNLAKLSKASNISPITLQQIGNLMIEIIGEQIKLEADLSRRLKMTRDLKRYQNNQMDMTIFCIKWNIDDKIIEEKVKCHLDKYFDKLNGLQLPKGENPH